MPDEYRKRAAAATKIAKGRKSKVDRAGVENKAKALNDMADEDLLTINDSKRHWAAS